MAKMKLEIDALRVESFDTAAGAAGRGTVHARSGEPGPGEVVLLPVTDWKTCQGSDCTMRTQCHYSCLEACIGEANAIGVD